VVHLAGRYKPGTHVRIVHHDMCKRNLTSYVLISHLLDTEPRCVQRWCKLLRRCFGFRERVPLRERNALHACHPCDCTGCALWNKQGQVDDFSFKFVQGLSAGWCRRVANWSTNKRVMHRNRVRHTTTYPERPHLVTRSQHE
jgi:hypothetical protein